MAAVEAGGGGADRRYDQASHLDAAIRAVDVQLSPEEVARLEAPYRAHGVLGNS